MYRNPDVLRHDRGILIAERVGTAIGKSDFACLFIRRADKVFGNALRLFRPFRAPVPGGRFGAEGAQPRDVPPVRRNVCRSEVLYYDSFYAPSHERTAPG